MQRELITRAWLVVPILVVALTRASSLAVPVTEAAPVPQAVPQMVPQATQLTVFPNGTIVSLRGTPHVWFADEAGVLHWMGDTRGLGIRVIAGYQIDLTGPQVLTLDQLKAARRGDPWLSAGVVKIGDTFFLAKWDIAEAAPALLHISSPAELELFGITSKNYGAHVLEAPEWERRFGFAVDTLTRGELRAAIRPAPTLPPCLPAVDGLSVTADGVAAKVRNICGVERRFALSAVIFDRLGNQPVATTNTAVWDAPAGDSRDVFLAGATNGGAWAIPLRSGAASGSAVVDLCLPVGVAECLETDPWLRQAVEVLQGLEQGQALLQMAAEFGVSLRRATLPDDLLGRYEHSTRTVTLDGRLDDVSDWERAAWLAHELQHAADHAAGLPRRDPADCIGREEDAFRREAHVWLQLWRSHLPEAQDQFQQDLNQIARVMIQDASRFTEELAEVYRHQCGG